MKNRKCVVASTLTIIALAVAGIMFCTNNAAKAATPGMSDILNILPPDCQFVFGMNVQKFVASPVFAKFKQKQNVQIGNDLSQFVATTGVDPERDIHYLVASGQAGAKAKGVIIAFGYFNQDKITSFIQSKSTLAINNYKGKQILVIPEGNGSTYKKGIVFLGDQIALGDLETLHAVLDGKFALLLHSIPDAMFWFAGNADAILASSPVAIPAGIKLPPIRTMVGTFSVTDSVVGNITATALDTDSAKQLVDAVNGLAAFGKMAAGNQDPTLQALFNGLTAAQNGSRIALSLNFPTNLLDALYQARKAIRPKAGI
jgi:hypothetical protein